MKGVWFVPSAVQRNWILSTHANVIGKAVMYVSREQTKLVWPLWQEELSWRRCKGLPEFVLKSERFKATLNHKNNIYIKKKQ
jgi:hypothetical protein